MNKKEQMKDKKKVKIDWRRELHSTNILSKIESYLNTYWDDDYKLWKIRKAIAKWRGEEIEDIMESDDPMDYLIGLTKRR